MSVGSKIEKWRRGQGLSQRAAAKTAGISQAAWCAIENDDIKRIGLEVVRRVVRTCAGAVLIEDFFVPERRRSRPPPAI